MWLSWKLWALLAATLGALTIFIVRKRRAKSRLLRTSLNFLGGLLALCSVLSLASATYLAWWYAGRATPLDRELFPGVRHVRVSVEQPRRVVANLIFINVQQRGLEFTVSQPDSQLRPKLRAATVGDFLQHSGAQLAINGNFFHPFHSHSPWDFYLKSGDPVEVLGIAASNGDQYSTQVWAGATLFIGKENALQLGGTVEAAWNAMAGDQWLLRDGELVAQPDHFGVYPRAAAAINAAGTTLILITVDGKQPGFSEGMSLIELAELLKRHGSHHAINLDGGGSVTLAAANSKGKIEILNSPIHTRIPGRQRPVANHLGLKITTFGAKIE